MSSRLPDRLIASALMLRDTDVARTVEKVRPGYDRRPDAYRLTGIQSYSHTLQHASQLDSGTRENSRRLSKIENIWLSLFDAAGGDGSALPACECRTLLKPHHAQLPSWRRQQHADDWHAIGRHDAAVQAGRLSRARFTDDAENIVPVLRGKSEEFTGSTKVDGNGEGSAPFP